VSTYFDTSFLVALYVPDDHSAGGLVTLDSDHVELAKA